MLLYDDILFSECIFTYISEPEHSFIPNSTNGHVSCSPIEEWNLQYVLYTDLIRLQKKCFFVRTQ